MVFYSCMWVCEGIFGNNILKQLQTTSSLSFLLVCQVKCMRHVSDHACHWRRETRDLSMPACACTPLTKIIWRKRETARSLKEFFLLQNIIIIIITNIMLLNKDLKIRPNLKSQLAWRKRFWLLGKKKWWWRIIQTVCDNFMAKDNVYAFCQITFVFDELTEQSLIIIIIIIVGGKRSLQS